ncbi:hypothetical protein BWQ96_10504 [Gracilariopsis chorda]|uniref:Uncharacterized protein n=1 Tax=Gracilariopsis chorda TaxID=448386 RepID=A0A2V3ICH4_9FLOR|nr:hypothetical protein BWQ96_10504 [Gracilariopsis chorda]|eukprot:PXF39789.1 hypothetical protein BWQ96_10504 [Gracilariopsis chorda]
MAAAPLFAAPNCNSASELSVVALSVTVGSLVKEERNMNTNASELLKAMEQRMAKIEKRMEVLEKMEKLEEEDSAKRVNNLRNELPGEFSFCMSAFYNLDLCSRTQVSDVRLGGIMLAATSPERVAAIATAREDLKRLGMELIEKMKQQVSFI